VESVDLAKARQVVPGPRPEFWSGKRVLLTGHTGFKGAWTALWLSRLGARVAGFALPADHPGTLYCAANIGDVCRCEIGDIRDRARLDAVVQSFRPHIVIHMAAQALVRRGVADPIGTFSTNVLGTVNLLDVLRRTEELTDVLVVTSDKVYRNPGESAPMDEGAALGGADPYSASKAACEHVAHSFAATYFAAKGIRLATARGGNVIGGGDRCEDRIIPDCVRALESGEPVRLRNPDAVRPWQHVLDCVSGYLTYVERLASAPDPANLPRALNFGPPPGQQLSVRELASLFFQAFGRSPGMIHDTGSDAIESQALRLDSSRAHAQLGWSCLLSQRDAVRWTAEWYQGVRDRPDAARALAEQQITAFAARLTGSTTDNEAFAARAAEAESG
jgi:CDP-glucose 4,6-dehydratase